MFVVRFVSRLLPSFFNLNHGCRVADDNYQPHHWVVVGLLLNFLTVVLSPLVFFVLNVFLLVYMSASPHIDFFFSPFLCIVTFYVLTPFSSRKFVHLFPFFPKKRRNALKREQGVTCLCDVANFHILFCYIDMHAHMRANNKFQLPLYGTKVNEEECVGIVRDQACPGAGRRRKLCFFLFLSIRFYPF
ncbi:hypothetical protein TbgDal_XI7520 [Trypanosoma brucei gambiense DAL972]|uniref:Uncharacterized protein n=1 Tax=Trypanosoma brucei gambiense (strain MHOM/CI/86/DAL972) TaxID=679716 RepID=D0A7I3_TRYB9|nr:hypothetical protein TbgDal_XI7520 [Trypanosoma brucei gambiense DAL972]CBH17634.1 hypothetical protein TbgDal_XI7520 [Trypanosoma brucei gambiense DAL972]|eukprot:XP_011779898.1 hypothetical protein TbgDal_XI7520 [Trypanosoma brucei gambiense DAL972]